MFNYFLILILLVLLLSGLTLETYQAPYFRSQAYQNVCEPDYGGLLRTKKNTSRQLSKNAR